MDKRLIYSIGITKASVLAAQELHLPLADHPTPKITHLLLDVPSFGSDGKLRSGENPEDILKRLPESITVIGGNLAHPVLDGYSKIDLLQDPDYQAKNAMITAHCAIKLALPHMDSTLLRCPVLILGWGRIGKCLAELLRAMGASVTVAARRESDRSMLRALGYQATDPAMISKILHGFILIYNTVPEKILSNSTTFRDDSIKIELASGRFLPGEDVIDGRGLPGQLAPVSSGKLIAETVLRRI